MRVTLVHNSNAGCGIPSHDALVSALEAAGHQVLETDDLDTHRKNGSEVVIAAGGDGTVLGVARKLLDTNVPMVLLPLGTANNFGRSLGMTPEVSHLLSVLDNPLERKIDLGVATGSWGARHFCESAGVGWFCDALTEAIDSDDKTVPRARAMLTDYLQRYQPRHWDLSIDGRNVSGEYVLIEVLNAGMLGPNLLLGSEADPSDGRLEVVMATRSDREVLLNYLAALQRGESPPPPPLHRRHARHLRIALGDRRVRVDGTTWPEAGAPMSSFTDLEILPGAVKVWLSHPPKPAKEQPELRHITSAQEGEAANAA